MGVIHKLEPKVRDFIINQKQASPAISCRRLSDLIHSRFKVYVSKSSISAVLKSANLSSRVGRPKKPVMHHIERPQVLDNAGAIFLKSADLELGLISAIAKFICAKFPGRDERSLKTRSELLTFLPAFGMANLAALQAYSGQGLWSLIGRKYKYPFLLREIEKMPNVQPIAEEIVMEIQDCLRGVEYLKITLSHGDILYLDPQFSSLWPTQDIPRELSLSLSKTKSYIERRFIHNTEPVVIQAGPDLKTAPNYFLYFVFSLEAQPQKRIVKVSLFSGSRELERFTPESHKKRHFIMGFLPQQVSRFLPVSTGNLQKILLTEPEKGEFYLQCSKIHITHITQQPTMQDITLNICLIRPNPKEQPNLCLLTNYTGQEKSWEEVLRLYFEHWPWYSVTKTSFSRYPNLLYTNKLDIISTRPDLSWLYTVFLETLNRYSQTRFFPEGYAGFDFSAMQERFYQISGKISREKGRLEVEFIPRPDFAWKKDFLWQKDFAFACQRVNQAHIFTPQKERICLKIL